MQLPYYNTSDFTPLFISKQNEISATITHHIAPFKFTDQHGNNFSEKDVQGKIHVANFFFTICGSICPAMMDNMSGLKEAFKNDNTVVLLSYSVMPWIDSVPKLKKYAEARKIEANWHLLTGEKSAIYALARQSYFAEKSLGYNKDSTDFLHTEHLVLVDKTGRIRGIYNGTLALETEQLIKDIRLLKEAE